MKVNHTNNLRPFQEELINTIFYGDEKVIIVEAPVGAGKTFVLRYLLTQEFKKRITFVFLYPTKILMESQVKSLKNEIGADNIRIWPYDEFKKNKLNLFLYSTDSLLQYILNNNLQEISDRSELLYRCFLTIQWYHKKGGIITSPDVFYLLLRGNYKNSKEILNIIQNSIIILDEFHWYFGLVGFEYLIEELLRTIAGKIVLLSATPLLSEELQKILNKYKTKIIMFDNSKGQKGDICFNYQLEATICSFKLSNRNETIKIIEKLSDKISFPSAIIFDSIFRLRHIERILKNKRIFSSSIKFKEWSGMKKTENFVIDNSTLVLGTSSIEVGIDMNFKSLLFEATHWPSSIQRLGRVGRKEKGKVFLFTQKDFSPFLEKKQYERDEFENILREVLNDPKEAISDDYSFRGKSFRFLLFDEELNEFFTYNERLFCMYEINDYVDDWQQQKEEDKKRLLKEYKVPEEKITSLLIEDKILPFWGVLRGKIKDEYEFLLDNIIYPTKERNELHIKSFVFYGNKYED
ncbi:MAG: type I-D CRISPR-associated helicase Cas3' [Elusimicrobiota bacterium]|nr:type I-D CRISPR-associated helicase Cas3' [Endomicrobiia bacterium]MDW8166272.1 type I-D CRISPR-associated helicase Cas3' [Elusimicrobiota bacterium]